MATTPTYSWPLPDDTDLVKDGAEAIRDLGNAIDSTVSSTTGLVHIETQNFSAASSVIFNDVFSADYHNYKIIFSNLSGSTATDMLLRLRVAGSDISTNNYNFQRIFANNTSLTSARDSSLSSFIGIGRYSTAANARGNTSIIEVTNPFLSVSTTVTTGHTGPGFTTALEYYLYIGQSTFTTSVTGFSMFPNGGNFTGTASVYGYKLGS
jgi:hypothetical protein